MANKATFTSTVNAFISVVVTIVKVKNALLEFINELWKASLIDTEVTTNVLTNGATSVEYILEFNKVGNKVFVIGEFYNGGGAIIAANEVLATVTNTEYLPKTGSGYRLVALPEVQSSSNPVRILMFNGTTGEIKCNGFLTVGTIYTIDGFYITND